MLINVLEDRPHRLFLPDPHDQLAVLRGRQDLELGDSCFSSSCIQSIIIERRPHQLDLELGVSFGELQLELEVLADDAFSLLLMLQRSFGLLDISFVEIRHIFFGFRVFLVV